MFDTPLKMKLGAQHPGLLDHFPHLNEAISRLRGLLDAFREDSSACQEVKAYQQMMHNRLTRLGFPSSLPSTADPSAPRLLVDLASKPIEIADDETQKAKILAPTLAFRWNLTV